MAACPLHVDIRAFTGHLAEGRWDRALAVLEKTMPLPGVLGRICDAPCHRACNRKKAGESIRIADLERACMQRNNDRRRVMPLPKKGIRVAVAGSGLSSLTVAWDLVRKGYDVTLFEPGETVGVGLASRYSSRLSPDIIATETAALARLGVQWETGTPLDTPGACQRVNQVHAAVYLGLDAVSGKPWGIDPEPVSDRGLTGRDGIFAGGSHLSPVFQAAQGRWAATSMDRWLQNVSMEAGREKEGPYESHLFTDLGDIAPLPAIAMADERAGYSEDDAVAEAGRCLQCQCLECVKVCAYLEAFGGYPKRYAREIYNNASIVMGERKANRLINSCSLCGLCEAVCPNDFSMADLCLTARQSMAQRGKMPPSAHDFALADMAFSQGDRFAMARHAPGHDSSRYLFFPGCQLCASAPGQVTRVYDFLRKKLSGGVALMLGCCGAPARWAGRQTAFDAELARWQETWQALGRPRPVMACATCLQVFHTHLPDIEAISLWEVLDTTGLPGTGIDLSRKALAIHDPCTTRDAPTVQNAVRRLLARLGVATEELHLGREKTECCGFGGLMQDANPELARETALRRGQRSESDFLAYCAMCRDNLAAVGKRTMHLLDLFFGDPDVPDPAARPRPGWSRRQENRERLKAGLLEKLWGETPPGQAVHQGVDLCFEPAVEAMLESRRILKEDIKKVIHHAENGGQRFRHADTGRYLAAFRPSRATFWVEYAPDPRGFKIYNAYAHRMEVLGP